MSGDARDFRVLDKLDGIGATGILGNANVSVIDVVIFIEHHVFEHRAETQRLEDVRFALRRQVNRLGVAAAFNVEDAFVTPAMLIVADQMAFRIRREGRFPCR